MSDQSWAGWLARTSGAVAIWLGGGAVCYRTALDSIPKPPANPAVGDVFQWAATGSDPAALAAAIASGLGLVASVFQIFGPKPYTAKQGLADRKHQNASFAAAEIQQVSRHAELLVSFASKEQQVAWQAELSAKIDKLAFQIAEKYPQQAEPLRVVVTELAGSTDARDVAIANKAVEEGPVAAADALIEREKTDASLTSAQLIQAARLYAAEAPDKALAMLERVHDADPSNADAWIDHVRLARASFGTDIAEQVILRALANVAQPFEKATLQIELGGILTQKGDMTRALKSYATAQMYLLDMDESDGLDSGEELAVSLSNSMASIYFYSGKSEHAFAILEDNIKYYSKFADKNNDQISSQITFIDALVNIIEKAIECDFIPLAQHYLRKMIDHRKKMIINFSEESFFRLIEIRIHRLQSLIYDANNQNDAACNQMLTAIEKWQALPDHDKAKFEQKSVAADLFHSAAHLILANAKQWDNAQQMAAGYFRQMIPFAEDVGRLDPGNRHFSDMLRDGYQNLGALAIDDDDLVAAEHWYRKSHDLLQRQHEISSDDIEIARRFAELKTYLSIPVGHQCRADEAAELCREAERIMLSIMEQNPDADNITQSVAAIREMLSIWQSK